MYDHDIESDPFYKFLGIVVVLIFIGGFFWDKGNARLFAFIAIVAGAVIALVYFFAKSWWEETKKEREDKVRDRQQMENSQQWNWQNQNNQINQKSRNNYGSNSGNTVRRDPDSISTSSFYKKK